MTPNTPQPQDAFLVASANFGGGATAGSIVGEAGRGRVAQLAELAADPCGGGRALAAPALLAIQEMVTLPGADDPLGELLAAVPGAAAHFTPITSTARYPLSSKWERRWDVDGPLDVSEGLAVLAPEPVVLRPATADHDLPLRHTSRGRVIDLPMLEFLPDAESASDDSWLHARVPWLDPPRDIAFRPTYYQGSRDTDPRAASAHVATFPAGGSTVDVVVVNLHLATLRGEAIGPRPDQPGDGAAFALRRPTVEAMYLRHRQLQVVAAFVDWVYELLRMPVVVLGDFNCEPGSPELDRFCAAAALTPALRAGTCWRCGSAPARTGQRRYVDAAFYRVRSQAPGEPDPDGLLPVTSDGYCGVADCDAPQFTHKRNLRLLDNVLVTDGASAAGRGLSSRLAFVTLPGAESASGINDAHEFSVHNSVWASLAAVPLDA